MYTSYPQEAEYYSSGLTRFSGYLISVSLGSKAVYDVRHRDRHLWLDPTSLMLDMMRTNMQLRSCPEAFAFRSCHHFQLEVYA